MLWAPRSSITGIWCPSAHTMKVYWQSQVRYFAFYPWTLRGWWFGKWWASNKPLSGILWQPARLGWVWFCYGEKNETDNLKLSNRPWSTTHISTLTSRYSVNLDYVLSLFTARVLETISYLDIIYRSRSISDESNKFFYSQNLCFTVDLCFVYW